MFLLLILIYGYLLTGTLLIGIITEQHSDCLSAEYSVEEDLRFLNYSTSSILVETDSF